MKVSTIRDGFNICWPRHHWHQICLVLFPLPEAESTALISEQTLREGTSQYRNSTFIYILLLFFRRWKWRIGPCFTIRSSYIHVPLLLAEGYMVYTMIHLVLSTKNTKLRSYLMISGIMYIYIIYIYIFYIYIYIYIYNPYKFPDKNSGTCYGSYAPPCWVVASAEASPLLWNGQEWSAEQLGLRPEASTKSSRHDKVWRASDTVIRDIY